MFRSNRVPSCNRRHAVVLTSAWFAGCTVPPQRPAVTLDEWGSVALPGKRETVYTLERFEGREAWHAKSDAAASLWRRRVRASVTPQTTVEFSWWVANTVLGADLKSPHAADSPARVGFAFDGDVARLPLRDRLQFQLIETMTGEPPPFATLMYVWDNHAPVESVVPNPRSDRIRTIVVEQGDTHLRQWRSYRRNLFDDFVRAYGEPPGELTGMALMTDTDSTGGSAEAWYSDVVLTV